MPDTRIERPAYAISRQHPRQEPISAPNSVRVYNYAPGLIVLQIRGNNHYTGSTLSLPDVDRLIDMLITARAEMYPDAKTARTETSTQ